MNNPGNQNSEPKEQIDQLKYYQLDPTFIQAIKQLKLRQSLGSQNPNPEVIKIGLAQMDFQDLLGTKYYEEKFINQFFNGKVEPWILAPSDFNDSIQKLMIWRQNISLIRKSQIPKIKLFVDDLSPQVQKNQSLLYSILHIQFNNLKALDITEERSNTFIDLQFLNWIEMPKLQALHIQTSNVVSLRPLCKTNLKELRELKITMSDDKKFTALCKDLPTFMSRIRTSKCSQGLQEVVDEPRKTLQFFRVENQSNLPRVNMFKADLRMPDMSSICKFESQTVHVNLLDSQIYNNRVHEVIKQKNCNYVIQYSQRIFDQMNRVRMRNEEDADNFFDQDQLQNRLNMFRNGRGNQRNRPFNYRQFQRDLQQDDFPIIGNHHLEV